MKNGLNKMKRKHIHFSKGLDAKSGMRYDCDMMIYIDVKKAMDDGGIGNPALKRCFRGIKFYKSQNDVILTPGIDGVLHRKYFKKVEKKTL